MIMLFLLFCLYTWIIIYKLQTIYFREKEILQQDVNVAYHLEENATLTVNIAIKHKWI